MVQNLGLQTSLEQNVPHPGGEPGIDCGWIIQSILNSSLYYFFVANLLKDIRIVYTFVEKIPSNYFLRNVVDYITLESWKVAYVATFRDFCVHGNIFPDIFKIFLNLVTQEYSFKSQKSIFTDNGLNPLKKTVYWIYKMSYLIKNSPHWII